MQQFCVANASHAKFKVACALFVIRKAQSAMQKEKSDRDSNSAEKQKSEREIANAIKWQNWWKTATN